MLSLTCDQHTFSLYTVTPSLVKIEMLPSSAIFPTLISNVGDSSNVSAYASLLESCRNGSVVRYLSFQASPLATPTFLADSRNIGRPNFSFLFAEVVSVCS